MKKQLAVMLMILLFFSGIKAQTFIAPDNESIKITGAMFNDVSSERIVFYRHSQDFYALPDNVAMANDKKAKTNTGITLNFKTDASNIKVHFKMLEGSNDYWLRTVYYIDGDSIETVKYKRDEVAAGDSTFLIEINSPSKGTHVYQIVFPTWSTYGFYGLTLTGGSESLENYELPERPFYVAYGNSITHGRGQFTGDQTYAWVLAQRMGWEVYNVAVGGSKTSVPMAAMIKNEMNRPVDYLSILIGYNDAVGFAKDTSYYRAKLIAFVDSVRAGHPETTIFVIGQTYTITTENSQGEPVNFDDWRKVQKFVVDSLTAQGDTLIHYINGADYTNYNDLNNPPTDPVHLSISGACRLGNALADTITKIIGNPNSVHYQTEDKTSIMLYPNPANDVLYVVIPDKSTKIDIFDARGKKVISKNISKNKDRFTVDIQNLTRGVYILKAGNATKTFLKK